MSWAYILSGLLALAIFVYLVIALLCRRSSDDCHGYLQLVFYIAVLVALAKPLGAYMRVSMKARRRWLNRWGAPIRAADLSPVAASICRRDCAGRNTRSRCFGSGLLGTLAVYALQRLQAVLPLNPANMGALSPDPRLTPRRAFATNTNWQGYGGRIDHELSHADARRSRCRTSCRRLPEWQLVALVRGFAAERADHRQFLGGPDPQHALRSSSAFNRLRSCPGESGHSADILAYPRFSARRVGRVRQSQGRRPTASP